MSFRAAWTGGKLLAVACILGFYALCGAVIVLCMAVAECFR